jgi:predicted hydrocarbon binding protein
MRRYLFHWGLLGDVGEGRPNLGDRTSVYVYRLMQFTFRDVLEKNYGTEAADRLFYDAGKTAGLAFYDNILDPVETLDEFVRKLQGIMKEMGIGVLRVEKSDLESGEFVITVSEDLDCSGLPEFDYEVCKYDEGFIAALLTRWSGKPYTAKEVDCWCSGSRTCRFQAVPEG